jgi:transcriptional regulator with XRE-family HTH domain
MHALGQRLRELRRARGLSLEGLATLGEVSASFLSLVETGRSDISLGRLMRIVGALDISLAELFAPTAPADVVVTRADERVPIPSFGEGIEMTLLSADARRAMTPFVAVYEPRGRMVEPTLPAGEGFLIVLEGTLSMRLEGRDEHWLLQAGDSVYLATTRKRRFENAGDGPARVVGALLRSPRADVAAWNAAGDPAGLLSAEVVAALARVSD